jgi:single-strand DNA-binding protein
MANLNLNKIILCGRLTADPELKTTASGISVTSFDIAVNRKVKGDEESKADFFRVVAWRNTAEFITRYFRKGSSICVTGSLQNRSWTDNDGVKHYATEVLVNEVFFVDSKSESQTAAAPAGYVPSAYTEPPMMEEIKDDEDLPF